MERKREHFSEVKTEKPKKGLFSKKKKDKQEIAIKEVKEVSPKENEIKEVLSNISENISHGIQTGIQSGIDIAKNVDLSRKSPSEKDKYLERVQVLLAKYHEDISYFSSTKEFVLDKYLKKREGIEDEVVKATFSAQSKFEELCLSIKKRFDDEFDKEAGAKNLEVIMERHKRALMGHKKEVSYFKGKVEEYLLKNDIKDIIYPSYYDSLIDAIFHENWGFAGLAEWVYCTRPDLIESTSAKIVGDRVFFRIGGKSVMQQQRINQKRLIQLRKALMLKTPELRLTEGNAEIYLLDGTRIALFTDKVCKEGQESIVFRKYIVKNYTYEKQIEFKTIPQYALRLFNMFPRMGFNVGFVGSMGSTKTTQLTNWQMMENPELEGVLLESDPEIPIHDLMPESPIMQFVLTDEQIRGARKSLMRTDADYFIFAEARNGVALQMLLDITDTGTKRVKFTYHTSDILNLPYTIAEKVCQETGGNIDSTMMRVLQNIHYIFDWTQLEDKSQKRLNGIYEYRYDPLTGGASIHQICRYNPDTDDWSWYYSLGDDKEKIIKRENKDSLEPFKKELKRIAIEHPMEEIVYYEKGIRKDVS